MSSKVKMLYSVYFFDFPKEIVDLPKNHINVSVIKQGVHGGKLKALISLKQVELQTDKELSKIVHNTLKLLKNSGKIIDFA